MLKYLSAVDIELKRAVNLLFCEVVKYAFATVTVEGVPVGLKSGRDESDTAAKIKFNGISK